ncbi:MAG: glutaredoxin domain-containing protein [Pseudomonadota bacterium]
MNKYVVVVLIVGLYLHWDDIGDFFAGTPDYQSADAGVVLYATEWCGYCDKTRELFAKHDIPFVEYDIEKSSQAHKEYKRLGGRGVPLVNANGTIVHGYSPQRILAASRPN